jgi:hypothetical protein
MRRPELRMTVGGTMLAVVVQAMKKLEWDRRRARRDSWLLR